MTIGKRIFLIVFLIIFITLLFIFSTIFENNLTINSNYKSFKNVFNYDFNNSDRYVKYYKNNKNLSYSTVVTYVNIGLDKGFYNDIKKANLSDNRLILVNKFYKLDKDYEPDNLEKINKRNFINGNSHVSSLEKEAKEAFETLSNDSIKNNTPVYGQSAYRSYDIQKDVYNNEVKNYGIEVADKQVARPGHSEHQTGLSIDVSSTKSGNMLDFENTISFLWMRYNAYKYGFILRYPKNKENIHGYIYEPWHYRYVGKKVAKDMYDNYGDLAYDEYFDKFIKKKSTD